MSVARRQRTLVRPVSVTGFGYFSGRDIRVEFWPASGRVRQKLVRALEDTRRADPVLPGAGELELF